MALVILGASTVVVGKNIAEDEALRDAQVRSEAIARSIAGPLVGSAVRHRDPEAMQDLDAVMRNRIRYGSVSHIVLWDTDGRILWAEDLTLVGKQFGLPPELQEVAKHGGAMVEQPGERAPHPGRGEGEDDLLEVYVGAVDADGERFMYESYLEADPIDQDYRAVIVALLPMSLLMLLLFQLATLPLALSLARRIDRANVHRSGILKRSLESWHEERRLLAQQLHDGVIQDLAGMSYALPAVIDQLPEGVGADPARATGQVMHETLGRSLTALREVMLDLAPASTEGTSVISVITELCQNMASVGLDVTLTVDPDLEVGESAGGLIYRIVREGMRNAHKHAGATGVLVSVGRRGDVVEVLVNDDGRGIPSAPATKGHVGLQLLGDTVRDVGGTLTLSNDPRGGARLRVVMPAWLPDVDERP